MSRRSLVSRGLPVLINLLDWRVDVGQANGDPIIPSEDSQCVEPQRDNVCYMLVSVVLITILRWFSFQRLLEVFIFNVVDGKWKRTKVLLSFL